MERFISLEERISLLTQKSVNMFVIMVTRGLRCSQLTLEEWEILLQVVVPSLHYFLVVCELLYVE